MLWTPNMLKSLQYLFKKGLSAANSAAEMNKMYADHLYAEERFTKNSVIGKWHRHGMERGRPQKVNSAEGNPPMQKKKKVYGPYLDIVRDELDNEQPGIGFEDLLAASCRWPLEGDAKVGGLSFCGRPREPGASAEYCRHHMHRAYR